MKLYRTEDGIFVQNESNYYALAGDWDALFQDDSLHDSLQEMVRASDPLPGKFALPHRLLPPVHRQEIWAAGVTYYRSREARMEESKDAGGGDFYDRVYSAARPELFFKSPPYRAVGHRGQVRIRSDSKWNVPEPELTLCISANGRIIGYSIGNDMSSRDIEGENPLYLPQAKSYDGATAVGPCILLTSAPLPRDTRIRIHIRRGGTVAFQGQTDISQIKRSFEDLVGYLYRETTFPYGCLLMTGTGIVPPDAFSLRSGDEIQIDIDGIGTLINTVA